MLIKGILILVKRFCFGTPEEDVRVPDHKKNLIIQRILVDRTISLTVAENRLCVFKEAHLNRIEIMEFNEINSKKYFKSLKEGEWLNVSDIPNCIFWSVWEIIENSKRVILHISEPKFFIRFSCV